MNRQILQIRPVTIQTVTTTEALRGLRKKATLRHRQVIVADHVVMCTLNQNGKSTISGRLPSHLLRFRLFQTCILDSLVIVGRVGRDIYVM